MIIESPCLKAIQLYFVKLFYKSDSPVLQLVSSQFDDIQPQYCAILDILYDMP